MKDLEAQTRKSRGLGDTEERATQALRDFGDALGVLPPPGAQQDPSRGILGDDDD